MTRNRIRVQSGGINPRALSRYAAWLICMWLVFGVQKGSASDPPHRYAISYELEIEAERLRTLTAVGQVASAENEFAAEATITLEYWLASPHFEAYIEADAVAEYSLIESRAGTEQSNDQSLERGETWLRWKPDPGGPAALTIGRQSFSDSREWWWDEDLDAARLEFQTDSWFADLALARELAPESTLDTEVDANQDGVLRLLGHFDWIWYPGHSLEGFLLYHSDHSSTPELGDTVRRGDSKDADITWLGLRAGGELRPMNYGSVFYRFEGARVQGHEDVLSFAADDRGLAVSQRRRSEVRGWALDFGLAWQPPVVGEPTVFVGYAFGSGDADTEDRTDRAFRQTGLHGNDDDFKFYGELFDPELSNLRVFTAGVSWPVFGDGLLAVTHHHYRQLEASPTLRDAGIAASPSGSDRGLGREWDVIVELDITPAFSVEFIASVFQSGRAFAGFDRRRAYSAYVELTYDF